jgi:hypothetical protein
LTPPGITFCAARKACCDNIKNPLKNKKGGIMKASRSEYNRPPPTPANP